MSDFNQTPDVSQNNNPQPNYPQQPAQQPNYQQDNNGYQPNMQPPAGYQPMQPLQPQQPAPQPDNKKGLAITSLVLGIVSVLLCCTVWMGAICGIAGLITGIMGLKSTTGKGMAITGVICSGVGVLAAVILLILGVIGLSLMEGYGYYY